MCKFCPAHRGSVYFSPICERSWFCLYLHTHFNIPHPWILLWTGGYNIHLVRSLIKELNEICSTCLFSNHMRVMVLSMSENNHLWLFVYACALFVRLIHSVNLHWRPTWCQTPGWVVGIREESSMDPACSDSKPGSWKGVMTQVDTVGSKWGAPSLRVSS